MKAKIMLNRINGKLDREIEQSEKSFEKVRLPRHKGYWEGRQEAFMIIKRYLGRFR